MPPEGTTGKVLKQRLKELWGHGCRVCGSVPLSGDNDPRVEGWLTVNYVGGVVCPGLCPPRHYEGAVGLVGGEGNKSLLPVGQIES